MKKILIATFALFTMFALQQVNAQETVSDEMIANANLKEGVKIFKRKCRSCHTLEENGKTKVGPNLWNIFEAKAGTRVGFKFSKTLKESALTWDYDSLNEYLINPKTYLPGNKMAFVGLPSPDHRTNLIAYLKKQTTPQNSDSKGDVAAE